MTQETEMTGIHFLKQFDHRQLFRFFVDGRFQKKCRGWAGYEAKEPGSVQAMLNGFACMMDNFYLSSSEYSHYLVHLHKTCMFNVQVDNMKSTPGELRYLSGGMPLFSKSTTLENIEELLEMRRHDNTIVFNTREFAKKAEELDAEAIFKKLHEVKRLNYRPWYPELDRRMTRFLNREGTLEEFYEAKHYVQKLFAQKVEILVGIYNQSIQQADSDDEKIRAIGKFVRDLELLHPFPDGNCRVFACVLLNHLLMYHGFCPAILKNPNLDGEVSYAQFEEEIRQGMQNTRILLEDKNAPLFQYSITETPDSENQRFLQMASAFIEKINAFSTYDIYLTPDILQRISSGKWLNPNPALRFTGVGSHNTVGRGFLYYCFLNEWKKQGKDASEELEKIIKRGARAIVLDDAGYAEQFKVPMLIVDDVDQTMKKVAMATCQEVVRDAVLVTGTVGKTSFKIQLHHCLKKQIRVHAFLNSINAKIPTLRSLSSLKPDDDLEVIEIAVGAKPAVAEQRSRWVNPDICVFTDLGPNHMDIHKTVENLVHAKASVVAGLKQGGMCIVNRDAQFYRELVAEIKKRNNDIPIYTFGTDKPADAYLVDARVDSRDYGWNICARIDEQEIQYRLPLFQNHAPVQSLGVLLVVHKLGYDVQQAATDYQDTIDSFESMGRLFRLKFDNKQVLFYDQSYRGAIQGMRSAFADIRNFNIIGRKIFVIGGTSVEKDTKYTREQHTEIAGLINDIGVDRLFTTGPYANYIHDNLDDRNILVKHSDDLDALAGGIKSELQDNDLLFIMGSGYLYLGRLGKKVLNFGRYDRIR
jgi:UDP-N-acetylmuramyl pentapeptide synthase